jgi:hypothetical protein
MSGLARSLAAYCADGLVRFWRRTKAPYPAHRLSITAGFSQAGDLHIPAIIAECASQKEPEEIQ